MTDTYRQQLELPEGRVKARKRSRDERPSFKQSLRMAMSTGDFDGLDY